MRSSAGLASAQRAKLATAAYCTPLLRLLGMPSAAPTPAGDGGYLSKHSSTCRLLQSLHSLGSRNVHEVSFHCRHQLGVQALHHIQPTQAQQLQPQQRGTRVAALGKRM